MNIQRLNVIFVVLRAKSLGLILIFIFTTRLYPGAKDGYYDWIYILDEDKMAVTVGKEKSIFLFSLNITCNCLARLDTRISDTLFLIG